MLYVFESLTPLWVVFSGEYLALFISFSSFLMSSFQKSLSFIMENIEHFLCSQNMYSTTRMIITNDMLSQQVVFLLVRWSSSRRNAGKAGNTDRITIHGLFATVVALPSTDNKYYACTLLP